MNIFVCGHDCDLFNLKLEYKYDGCRVSTAYGKCVWNGAVTCTKCIVCSE